MQFRHIIGQEAAKNNIREAVSANHLAHALLLVGPEGVGQMALALAIAQYVNCEARQEGDSCGSCSHCRKIQKLIHPDVRLILPIISKTEGGKRYLTADYMSEFREPFIADPYMSFAAWQRILGGENKQLFISVHEIRALRKDIFLKAFVAPYKIVIVWRAELINREGANAFLKLLEEPPDQTLIIMTCSDPGALLSTINSRCQRLRMTRLSTAHIQERIMQQHSLAPEKAQELAMISAGSMGQASEYLSAQSETLSQLYIEWLRAIYTGHFDKIRAQNERIYKEHKEFQKRFLTVAVKKIRDSLLFHLNIPDLALASERERAFQEKFSALVNPAKVSQIASAIEDSHRHLSGNANSQMVFTDLALSVHRILRN